MATLAFGRGFGNLAARTARRYLRHVYAGFDLVLAPSRSMLGHLVDAGIDKASCQPLGVDTTVFHPSRASAGWRGAHGLDADARVLVYAGRFASEKHLDVLADAVALLGAPYVLVAIGAGPSPPPAGERVRVVPFLSSVDELATALASADAFVHAGDQETFGLSALEALACSTPIVVPDADGLGELADAGSGLVVRERTGKAFADAIAALFERDREAMRLSARARAEAYDWDHVFGDLSGRYLRLLARDRPARVDVGAALSPGSRLSQRP
jgi:alpha-1,6-mannosyltransferase